MSLFIESQLRARARAATPSYKSVSTVLSERMQTQARTSEHDIFLSHAYDDKELILGVTLVIEGLGYSVFLDWRDDPSLSRNNVTPQTAATLRARMTASRCLFFSTTLHASESKWMPWELGFKDGNNGRAAILPISWQATESYQGQQYLGIYPYVTKQPNRMGQERLWIRRSPACYVEFEDWLEGNEPMERSE